MIPGSGRIWISISVSSPETSGFFFFLLAIHNLLNGGLYPEAKEEEEIRGKIFVNLFGNIFKELSSQSS